jgi:hypothetical protein
MARHFLLHELGDNEEERSHGTKKPSTQSETAATAFMGKNKHTLIINYSKNLNETLKYFVLGWLLSALFLWTVSSR